MDEHEITPLVGDLASLMEKTFANDGYTGYVKVDECVLPERYKQFADDIENFQVRDEDVWVCSFPKTGTTWTQEMVWSIANDLDFERGKVPINKRFPHFENSILHSTSEVAQRDAGIIHPEDTLDTVSYAGNIPSPRFFKSHLPVNLLPRQLRTGERKPKIVYVVRNAKDTCISYYHFCKFRTGCDGSFQDFATLFLGDTDLPSVIRKTATFLGKNLTNDQVSVLAEHLSFSTMKVNPAVNYEGLISGLHKALQVEREGAFMRSGMTGQWKTMMSPELIECFDDETDEHWDGTDFPL